MTVVGEFMELDIGGLIQSYERITKKLEELNRCKGDIPPNQFRDLIIVLRALSAQLHNFLMGHRLIG